MDKNMDSQLKYLKTRASDCFKGLVNVLETLNRDYPNPNTRWEMDEMNKTVRRMKLPSFEWDEFDEPNDKLFDDEDQERVLKQ
jgi:hypothetical protein